MKVSIQETQPKLQEHLQQQGSDKRKMKFNWRANWEILLVLVIIVVGIVITTIAAIRNKEKHLLVIPDETDYGHLLASTGIHNAANNLADQQNQVPRLPQVDFQLNSAQTLSNNDDGGNGLEKSFTPKSVDQQQSINGLGRNQKHYVKGNGQQTQQQQTRTTNGQQHAHQNGKPQAKFEDQQQDLAITPILQPQTGHDLYEALGTEPTPSQARVDANTKTKNSHQNRRNVNNSKNSIAQQQLKLEDTSNDRAQNVLDDQLVDDIHTTRSSLASSKNYGQLGGVTESSLTTSDSTTPHLTPSLSMHGPYGFMLPTITNDQHHSSTTHQNRSKQVDPLAIANEAEDMMTSYSRNNLTDTQFDTSSLLNTNITSDETVSGDLGTIQDQRQRQIQLNQLPTHRHRNQLAAHSLPFSLLLSDLIKLTRQNSLINPQAGLEKPANSRPQYSGILQQLRSLPGPILSLLQNSVSANSANMFNDYNSMTQNHDMSESNQHYHQIPMSTNDILTMRSASNLPAFPSPKGTPSVWYPPTVGGNPTIHDAMNSNADFVASNVAGFVRSPKSQVKAAASGSLEQSSYANDDHNYRRQINENSPTVAQDNQHHQQQPALHSHQQQQQQQIPQQFQNAQPQHQTMSNNMISQQSNSQSNIATNVMRNIAHQNGQLFSNQRPISEMQQVPLGYNPQIQQQPQLQPVRHQYEFGGLLSESTSKVSITPLVSNQPNVGSRPATGQPQPITQNGIVQPTPVQLNTIARQKRAIEDAEVTNAEMDEEEELLDSRPISIVMPDGRPMSHGKRLKMKSKDSKQPRPASSQRQANHFDFDQRALHHYTSQTSQESTPSDDKERYHGHLYSRESPHSRSNHPTTTKKTAKLRYGNGKRRKNTALEAAGSGLMSKLLGTASTNDEQEEDFDGDEDDNNERRKEELEDAEFGIVNERQNLVDNDGSARVNSGGTSRPVDNSIAPENRDSDSSIGSGSAENEAYTRRNQQQQQRADVEFYGHPGEESRHLKYGILGSGNYEVVNGGIYPESDESTAAVNSVANYVRKPKVFLADLSKLAMGPSNNDHHSNSLDPTGGPQAAAFMPGGRIAVGHMRGASTNPDDLIRFVPATGNPIVPIAHKGMHNPLLDLIDANNGHMFDPNLVTQLGSSAQTTFTSQEGSNSDEEINDSSRKNKPNTGGGDSRQEQSPNHEGDNLDEMHTRKTQGRKKKFGNTKTNNAQLTEDNHDQQASNSKHQAASRSKLSSSLSDDHVGNGSGGKSLGTNQFYSYQILPSKKVTIFSDQDLDSAPSERVESMKF